MNQVTSVLLLAAVFVGEVLCSVHSPTAWPVVLQATHEVAAAKSAHLATLSQSHNHPSSAPHVLHRHVADTHEVAAAKAEHFAAVAKARAQGGYRGTDYSHSGNYADGYNNYGPSASYNSYGYDDTFHGPDAKPIVLHDGHIADTHEVAAAKAEHFAAVAKARTQVGYQGSDYSHSGNYADGYSNYGSSASYNSYGNDATFHGPSAKPVVLHDGHIADTHEVAAAKAEHFAAVAKARAHGGDYSGNYGAGAPGHLYGAPAVYGAHSSLNGDLARPVVLPSGYLADTHEVAHAKQQHLNLLLSSRTQGYKAY